MPFSFLNRIIRQKRYADNKSDSDTDCNQLDLEPCYDNTVSESQSEVIEITDSGDANYTDEGYVNEDI